MEATLNVRQTPFLDAALALTRRWMWRLKREPANIAASLAQPALWLVLFGNLFQANPVDPRYSYLAFLTAGVVVMTVFNGALAGGVEILFDRETGLLQRLVAAPIPTGAILASRVAFVLGLSTAQALIILLVALLLGVEIAAGAPGVVLIVATGLLLGIGITAVSMALAFGLSGHGQFFAITGFVSLPLIFASSALAPLDAMPPWLQLIARFNPLTYAIESVRQLILAGWDWGLLLAMGSVITIFDAVAIAICLWLMQRALE